MLDIEGLLAPVSVGIPAGENLEYAEVDQLERLALGTRGVYDPSTQEEVGAVEPDWRQVRDSAIGLFARTKDLRVCVLLTFALLRLEGWSGLAAGLTLIEGLLERYWDGVYPPLDKEAGDDPIDRLNVLANLTDPERSLPMFRATVILESREVGRYTLRDLDLAQGRLPVSEGTRAPSLELLAAAWLKGVDEHNRLRQSGVEQALRAVKAINQGFQDRCGQSPGLDAIGQLLWRLKEFYGSVVSQGEPTETVVEPAGEYLQAQTVAAGRAGSLSSRAEAVRLLKQVSEFLKRTEPCNPAPIFIDRAARLAELDFVGIVKELMPESKERIELFGGIRFED